MVSTLDSGASGPGSSRDSVFARDSVLCSWARHFTFIVPLSTQVYKWVPAICWGNLTLFTKLRTENNLFMLLTL